jgi:hypothetical protein
LGKRIAARVNAEEVARAYAMLAPMLAERTPFAALDLIGQVVGSGPLERCHVLLEEIASHETEGGWAVIGKALGQQLTRDLPGAGDELRAGDRPAPPLAP